MPTVFKSGSLNLLEPSWPLQAFNGVDLPFTIHLHQHCLFTVSVLLLVRSVNTNKLWCLIRNRETLDRTGPHRHHYLFTSGGLTILIGIDILLLSVTAEKICYFGNGCCIRLLSVRYQMHCHSNNINFPPHSLQVTNPAGLIIKLQDNT